MHNIRVNMHDMHHNMHNMQWNMHVMQWNMHVMHVQNMPAGGEIQATSDGRASVCGDGGPLKVARHR